MDAKSASHIAPSRWFCWQLIAATAGTRAAFFNYGLTVSARRFLLGFTRSAPIDAQRLRTATKWKDEMAYDAQSHRPHGSVDLSDRDQIANWCADLGCTEAQLREAVRMAGPDHMFVQQWIKWLHLV